MPRSTVKFAEDCEAGGQDGWQLWKKHSISRNRMRSLTFLELDSLMSSLVLASQFMSMFDDWLWPWTRAEPTKDPGPIEGPPGTDKILCFGIWVGQVVRCIQRRRRDRSRGGRHEMNHKRTESRWINLYHVKLETVGDRLRQCHVYKCLQAPSGCLALFSYPCYSMLVLDSLYEQWKNPVCLGYIGDYATQLCGDYSKPS